MHVNIFITFKYVEKCFEDVYEMMIWEYFYEFYEKLVFMICLKKYVKNMMLNDAWVCESTYVVINVELMTLGLRNPGHHATRPLGWVPFGTTKWKTIGPKWKTTGLRTIWHQDDENK
jgi:hypothetical protein